MEIYGLLFEAFSLKRTRQAPASLVVPVLEPIIFIFAGVLAVPLKYLFVFVHVISFISPLLPGKLAVYVVFPIIFLNSLFFIASLKIKYKSYAVV